MKKLCENVREKGQKVGKVVLRYCIMIISQPISQFLAKNQNFTTTLVSLEIFPSLKQNFMNTHCSFIASITKLSTRLNYCFIEIPINKYCY